MRAAARRRPGARRTFDSRNAAIPAFHCRDLRARPQSPSAVPSLCEVCGDARPGARSASGWRRAEVGLGTAAHQVRREDVSILDAAVRAGRIRRAAGLATHERATLVVVVDADVGARRDGGIALVSPDLISPASRLSRRGGGATSIVRDLLGEASGTEPGARRQRLEARDRSVRCGVGVCSGAAAAEHGEQQSHNGQVPDSFHRAPRSENLTTKRGPRRLRRAPANRW